MSEAAGVLQPSRTSQLKPIGQQQQQIHQRPAVCGGWAVKSVQGRAKMQEDAYTVHELGAPANSATATGLFLAVYDGHGGDEVSLHCASRLHLHFTSALATAVARGADDGDAAAQGWESTDADSTGDCSGPCLQSPPLSPMTPSMLPHADSDLVLRRPQSAATVEDGASGTSFVSEALRASFRLTDQELVGTEQGEFVGSTGVAVVLGKDHIWVANCGDSRAALQRSGSAMALTSDHKPSREDEAARVRNAGGRISFNHGAPRVMGMLAMTRCIGDHYLRPFIIPDPEVVCLERSEEDEVLLIATDGLWDVFSCTEATNMASRCIQRSRERGMSRQGACQVAASVLTQAAMDRGSRDNVTVIVVSLAAQDALDEERELTGAGGHPLRHGLALKCNSGTCSPGWMNRGLIRQACSHDDLTKLHPDLGSAPQGCPKGQEAGPATACEAAAALGAVLSLGAGMQGCSSRPPRHRPPYPQAQGQASLMMKALLNDDQQKQEQGREHAGGRLSQRGMPVSEGGQELPGSGIAAGDVDSGGSSCVSSPTGSDSILCGPDEEEGEEASISTSGDMTPTASACGHEDAPAAVESLVAALVVAGEDGSEDGAWDGGLPSLLPRLAGADGLPVLPGGEADVVAVLRAQFPAPEEGHSHAGRASLHASSVPLASAVPAAGCCAPAMHHRSRTQDSVDEPGQEEGEALLHRASWLSVEVTGGSSAVAVLRLGAPASGDAAEEGWEWSRASVP